MEKIGSQMRDKIRDTEYLVDVIEGNKLTGRDAILLNTMCNKLELWTENNNAAGYVIEIEGVGYEFVRSL